MKRLAALIFLNLDIENLSKEDVVIYLNYLEKEIPKTVNDEKRKLLTSKIRLLERLVAIYGKIIKQKYQ